MKGICKKLNNVWCVRDTKIWIKTGTDDEGKEEGYFATRYYEVSESSLLQCEEGMEVEFSLVNEIKTSDGIYGIIGRG